MTRHSPPCVDRRDSGQAFGDTVDGLAPAQLASTIDRREPRGAQHRHEPGGAREVPVHRPT
jgi:hypothetical protein